MSDTIYYTLQEFTGSGEELEKVHEIKQEIDVQSDSYVSDIESDTVYRRAILEDGSTKTESNKHCIFKDDGEIIYQKDSTEYQIIKDNKLVEEYHGGVRTVYDTEDKGNYTKESIYNEYSDSGITKRILISKESVFDESFTRSFIQEDICNTLLIDIDGMTYNAINLANSSTNFLSNTSRIIIIEEEDIRNNTKLKSVRFEKDDETRLFEIGIRTKEGGGEYIILDKLYLLFTSTDEVSNKLYTSDILINYFDSKNSYRYSARTVNLSTINIFDYRVDSHNGTANVIDNIIYLTETNKKSYVSSMKRQIGDNITYEVSIDILVKDKLSERFEDIVKYTNDSDDLYIDLASHRIRGYKLLRRKIYDSSDRITNDIKYYKSGNDILTYAIRFIPRKGKVLAHTIYDFTGTKYSGDKIYDIELNHNDDNQKIYYNLKIIERNTESDTVSKIETYSMEVGYDQKLIGDQEFVENTINDIFRSLFDEKLKLDKV